MERAAHTLWRRDLVVGVLALGALASGPACSRQTQPASNREVWAEVDGVPIFRDQVEQYYRSRMPPASDPGSQGEALSFKLSILNQLIDNQILQAHAAKSQVTASEPEVDAKVQQLRGAYSEQEFEAKLKEQGLRLDELRQEVRQNLVVEKLLNKEVGSRLIVTQAEIEKYYQQNKASFSVPETQYHLAQILVTPKPDGRAESLKRYDAKSSAAARRKVEEVYAQLRAGKDFRTVAQEHSEDPRTAPGGGDMGFLPVTSLASDPVLRQAINSLRVGQISGILRERNGDYHIIKLLGREDAGQRDLSDLQVQSTIRRTLLAQKEQLLKAAYIEDLRNRAKVVDHLAEQIVRAEGNPPAVR